jgi:hypothetical protein
LLTPEIVSYALGIVALLNVGVVLWTSIRKPQEKSTINDAIFEEKFGALSATVTNLRDNHMHTLDLKLEKHIQDNQSFALDTTKSLTRVETLLEQILKK